MASAERQFKDTTYEHLARIGKATAAPKRLIAAVAEVPAKPAVREQILRLNCGQEATSP